MSNSEKPKFTPKPWHVRQGTKSGFDGGRYFVCHEEHGYIACMSFPDDGDDYDNAILIAAAPDLYEAIAALFDYAKKHPNDGVGNLIDYGEVGLKLLVAKRKAEGRS